jgi:Spermine/spermidine synthase domain
MTEEGDGFNVLRRNGVGIGRSEVILFLASFLALYFELVIIRYLSSEIRVFAYLKNLALIASFFGIGMGMIPGGTNVALKRYFPFIAVAIFLIIAFASPLKLTHVAFPIGDYITPGDLPSLHNERWFAVYLFLNISEFLIIIPGMMYLLVAFFEVLGGIVGEYLKQIKPLRGYGINLAGSLAGILTFTLLSFLRLPPAIWVLVGLLVGLPLFIRVRHAVLAFSLIVVTLAFAHPHTYWSPYYRIDMQELPRPRGWQRPSAIVVTVNHDYHQAIVDLSREFMSRFASTELNRTAVNYDLPYKFASHPGRVLVVGAGTGNDVAAALRHEALHVDAVEIDPVILQLGRKFHPEHPYDSPRVTVFVDDARAFFRKSYQKYDLIVFGYLDSHTLLTSMSSVRLDNYVYTLESFRAARQLLADNGTLVLGFSSGKSFLGDRMFATLWEAFGSPPRAYFTGAGETGVVYVEGANSQAVKITDFPDIGAEFQSRRSITLLATDHWPFLYLRTRAIPVSILMVLVLFLYIAVGTVRRKIQLSLQGGPKDLHLFFLGAGFMLLETKGVTELSLLFGSTWVVNAVVIAAFLFMGLLANGLVALRPISRRLAYSGLLIFLIAGMIVPYSMLGALPTIEKVVAAGTLVGLPVFFSGLVFSGSFRDYRQPARGLGINLLGAVVGGVLENLVMVGGTPILGMLAIALYGASAIAIEIPSLVPKRSLAEDSVDKE